MPTRRLVAGSQAVYYLTTGIWPLASRRTFESITGPKRDFWLVQTVGALIGVTGASLALAARDSRAVEEASIKTLAIGSALSLAAVDVAFVAKRCISPIYLLDATAELVLAAGWILGPRLRPKLKRGRSLRVGRDANTAIAPATATPRPKLRLTLSSQRSRELEQSCQRKR
jgi:hypothetical protein